MKKLFIPLMLCFVLFSSCTIDVVVDPTPVEINLAIEPSPIDGYWVGTMRDDIAETWWVRIHIGITNNIRVLEGIIEVTDHNVNNMQPFPIQHTEPEIGIVLHPDGSWFTKIYLTSIWSVSGRLIDQDTMEISIASTWPRDIVYTLHRSDGTNWPRKN